MNFLPVVKFKEPSKYVVENEELIISDEEITLSEHLDGDKRTFKILQLTTSKEKIKLPFTIKKGSDDTWDDDGYIEPTLSVENESFKATSNMKILKKYNTEIEVEIELKGTKTTEFYLDFYANDNEDDFNKGEYENVHCGRVKILYDHIPKVGLRLTSNIESLPLAPDDYEEPPTFSEPKKSFEVANKYQNCYGMCFAVSMARVRKAYLDEFDKDVISLDLNSKDYLYSGTVVSGIPDLYLGYGVGGGL